MNTVVRKMNPVIKAMSTRNLPIKRSVSNTKDIVSTAKELQRQALNHWDNSRYFDCHRILRVARRNLEKVVNPTDTSKELKQNISTQELDAKNACNQINKDSHLRAAVEAFTKIPR